MLADGLAGDTAFFVAGVVDALPLIIAFFCPYIYFPYF
jgi:hypothetical protein